MITELKIRTQHIIGLRLVVRNIPLKGHLKEGANFKFKKI